MSMLYRERTPGGPLSRYAELLWYCEGYKASHRRERVLPHGTVELVICLAHDRIAHWEQHPTPEPVERMSPMLVAGVHTGYMVIDTAGLDGMIGVHFRPGAAGAFFGVPSAEFTNSHVDLDALWGRAAWELRERLLAASSADDKLSLLDSLLAGRLRPLAPHHPAVAFALREFETRAPSGTVAEVSRRIGLSSRRFTEIFREHVGVTPKLYYRMRRFQEALRRARAGHEVRWAGLALACGYYDQAHFIHDFREFSGINPNAYLVNRGQWANHVPLFD